MMQSQRAMQSSSGRLPRACGQFGDILAPTPTVADIDDVKLDSFWLDY